MPIFPPGSDGSRSVVCTGTNARQVLAAHHRDAIPDSLPSTDSIGCVASVTETPDDWGIRYLT